MTTKIIGPVISFVANDYIIGYITNKAILAYRNPLFYDKISVIGPNESLKFEFLDYCSKFLTSQIPFFNAEMDK